MFSPSRLLPTLLLGSIALSAPARGEEIGWIERYALAEDRPALLAELIPGSEDHFFFHSLHYQVTGDLERAEGMLRQWENSIEARRLSETPRLVAIRDRQRLLTYGASPDRTLTYLKDRLGIRHDHPAPPQAGERQWPDALAAERIEVDRLIDEAVRTDRQLTAAGLRRLAARFLNDQVAGLPVDRTWLLQQIDAPGIVDDLDRLVIAELRARPAQERRFGDRPAHQQLTLDQLQRVAREVAEVRSDDAMVREVLLRLHPSDDEDPSSDPQIQRAYLERLDTYVQTLPPAYNSLKASVLYRLLEADLAQGRPNRERLLRYLQLPRHSPLVPQPRLQVRGETIANLSHDFSDRALLPPIIDEEPLVRALLEHFLREADSPDEFAPYLRPDYLNRVFAETKLLYGIGPPDRWFRQLPPAYQQALRDRVELTLAPTNRPIHSPDDSSALEVDIKNVETLIVRIFEINTHAYYRTHQRPIDTDVDLDGLVPTHEQRFEYQLPAVRRHRETIELPEISGRGVWVVDLLGGGRRARAVIRRGTLRLLETPDELGQRFTVLDDQGRPVPEARMWIAGQEIEADERGRIELPPSDEDRQRRARVGDAVIAVPVEFRHRGEAYALSAPMELNRQQLRSSHSADLLVRPHLTLAGRAIDPRALEEVSLEVTATDHDGIATTRHFRDLVLDDHGETTVSFRIPPRLAKLRATLRGRLERIADGRQIDLEDSTQWDTNGIERTDATRDVHLTRDGDQWILEARGRNGEPVAGATIQLRLTHEVRRQPIDVTLQTDAAGRVRLGALPGIVQLSASVGGGPAEQTRSLQLDRVAWPRRLHAEAGTPLRLPLADAEGEPGDRFLLWELRSERVERDRSENLKVESGMLVAGPLSGGNYRLLDRKTGTTVSIAVAEGHKQEQVAASGSRLLETLPPTGPGIASLERDEEGVTLRLTGATASTRIHVLGSRYLPPSDPLSALRLPYPTPAAVASPPALSGYVSDLRLGDEYQYVLRRQFASKYPGVMLPQPSLLLNPWETETTQTAGQQVAEGEAVPPSAARPPAQAAAPESESRARERQAAVSQSLQFLPRGGVVLSNLRPDDDGVLHIAADDLAQVTVLQIVVTDTRATLQRTLFEPLPELEPRDLRLPRSLDPEEDFAFQRGVMIAGPEKPLDLASLGSAQIQVYSTVADLLELYTTLSGDGRMAEFRPLGRWHRMSDAEKRALYGRLACHELHIFLRAKDPEFFESVVRPYLQNKQDKQLVDVWLLGGDLKAWSELWRFARLHPIEKAILAREVPEVREAVLREMRERVELEEIDPEVLRRQIDAALAGRALQESLERSSSGKRLGEADAFHFYADDPSSRAEGMMMGGMGGMALGMPAEDADFAAPAAAAEDAEGAAARLFDASTLRRDRASRRGLGRDLGFFQKLDATKQWAESHWDRVRVANVGPGLVPLDPFWLDWAEARDEGAIEVAVENFLSEHLLRPTANRHAALVALALAALPLEAGEVDLPAEGDYTPAHPVAVISKRLIELQPLEGDPTILVGQRFEAADAPPLRPDDPRATQIAPEEFLTGHAYRGQIVLTNPTPVPRPVEVLWQIPAGSLPLEGGQPTDSRSLQLEPFAVQRIDYLFYFPAAGDFVHYPVSVAHEGQTVARGETRTFTVVEQPTEIDDQSWERIARTGSAEQIANFLREANLRKLELQRVLHRLTDQEVYSAVLDVLQSARLWHAEIWAYSLLHRDEPRMRSYLAQRDDLVGSAGPVLQSPLLVIEPVERALYEHLEYSPLVVPRIHPLRERPEIQNDRLLVQYRRLMEVIAHQSAPTEPQRFALSYYLLLQNRIEEALEWFQDLERESTPMRLQYDYLAAYLAMHRGDYQLAGQVASEHAAHPVPRWRSRFEELADQLRQRGDLLSGSRLVADAGGDAEGEGAEEEVGVRTDAADLAVMDRERRQADRAARQPAISLRVDGDRLRIDYRNATEATLHFYAVDLELLFSKTPFVRDDLGRMATVRPQQSRPVPLDGEEGTIEVPIEGALAQQTLLVEIVAGPARATALYYGGGVTTHVSEGFGQLQVTEAATRQPVSSAYVKVYARHRGGEVRFYKDGYTDLRGRFDFATLSTDDLQTAERLAILVLDPERGATVHDVAPPTR